MSQWGARAAALGKSVPPGRGARWLARQAGGTIAAFRDVAKVPEWVGWGEARRRRLGMTATLLQHRAQIDRELRGDVLAPLAAMVGEPLFDAICVADVADDAGSDALPAPNLLDSLGQRILADSWRPDGEGSGEAARLTDAAIALIARETA